MAINFTKSTIKAQEAIEASGEIASSYGNQQIEPEHVLAALIQSNDSVAVSIIQKIGVDMDYLRIKTSALIDKFPKISASSASNQFISQGLAKVLDDSFKTASQLKDEYVSTEHILISISESQSEAGKLFRENG